MGSDGSVQNAQTMTCVQYVIIVTNTILDIDFTESQLLVLKGKLFSIFNLPPGKYYDIYNIKLSGFCLNPGEKVRK
jgi:hypothetical protein